MNAAATTQSPISPAPIAATAVFHQRDERAVERSVLIPSMGGIGQLIFLIREKQDQRRSLPDFKWIVFCIIMSPLLDATSVADRLKPT